MPADPFFLRIFGAVQCGLVFLYWFAYQNPVQNATLSLCVIDNALSFLTIIGVGLTHRAFPTPPYGFPAVLVLNLCHCLLVPHTRRSDFGAKGWR